MPLGLRLLIVFSVCFSVFSAQFSFADSTTSIPITSGPRNYVRLLLDQKTSEPIALQTSIEHLSGTDSMGSFQIDLISAVHIAESSYYKQLNSRFASYDGVLFELVADPSIDRNLIGQHSDNPLSVGQKVLQNILGLSFQLEQINYRAANFIHADMSPEQFSESMQKRGESLSQMLLNVMLHSMANTDNRAPPNLSDLIMLGFSQTRAVGLRRSLARQFQDMDSMLSALNGAEGSTIISERNKVAVAVAKAELGKGKRKLSIFYGGAHMPNMKEQIQSALVVRSEGVEWLNAWNLVVEK